jgi:hypothetical protein
MLSFAVLGRVVSHGPHGRTLTLGEAIFLRRLAPSLLATGTGSAPFMVGQTCAPPCRYAIFARYRWTLNLCPWVPQFEDRAAVCGAASSASDGGQGVSYTGPGTTLNERSRNPRRALPEVELT